MKKHQMLTKYQWRECTRDEKNITSNDNKGTEVGYKNANEKKLFAQHTAFYKHRINLSVSQLLAKDVLH